jgi:hypothetical protein
MSTLAVYRSLASGEATVNSAKLGRGSSPEAPDAWSVFAAGMGKRAALRIKLAAAQPLMEPSENPDRGCASR